MLSLPFALVGGLWLMWWLGFNLSVAVVVGFIALAGVAAETGVVMLIYLNQALEERRAREAGERCGVAPRGTSPTPPGGGGGGGGPHMVTVVGSTSRLLPSMCTIGT